MGMIYINDHFYPVPERTSCKIALEDQAPSPEP